MPNRFFPGLGITIFFNVTTSPDDFQWNWTGAHGDTSRVSRDNARSVGTRLFPGQHSSPAMPFTHDLVRSKRGIGVERNAGKQKGEGGDAENHPFPSILLLNNGFDRTYLSATAAIGTFLLVNHIGFPLFNGFCRTFLCTGSARHAFIGNHIGHVDHLLYL